MLKRQWLLSLLILILLTSSVLAIRATPAKFDIGYAPGNSATIIVQVGGTEDPQIEIDGDLAPHVTSAELLKDDNGVYSARVTVVIPSNLTPGGHSFGILLSEKDKVEYGQRPQVGAKVKLRVPVYLTVPYPGKYLAYTQFDYDRKLNRGDTMYFTVFLISQGNEMINTVTGKVNINTSIDPTLIFSAPLTTATNVQLSEVVELRGEWLVPSTLPLGPYSIKPSVEYDGVPIEIPEFYFQIGDLELKIVDVSPLTLETGQISTIDVRVKNMWANDVTAKVDLAITQKDGTLLKETSSPDIGFSGLADKIVTLYVDAQTIPEGEYNAQITVHYADKITQATYPITISANNPSTAPQIPPTNESDSSLTLPIILGLVGVIVLIAALFLWFKKRREEFEDEV